MLWGLDAAYPPPDLLTAQDYKAKGWSWFAGYIGGAALHVWSVQEWQRVYSVGFSILPIWVAPLSPGEWTRDRGVQDGNDALLRMVGLGLTSNLVLDIENGEVPLEYAAGFVDAVHAGSCDVTLYGLSKTLLGLQDVGADHWWLAFWTSPALPIYSAPCDWEVWQFNDGPETDYNVAVDSFPFAGVSPPPA
jgi:hypothetical protein